MMGFLKRLQRRRRLDRDLEDELQFHLEMSQEEGAGNLGNATLWKETCRDMWSFVTLETWWQDIRYAARTLRNNPGFVAVAVLALALGIGANTTIFTIVSAALAFDLGVDNVDRLVMLRPADGPISTYLDFRSIQPQMKTVDNLAAYDMLSVNISDQSGALPDRFVAARMSASGFPLMRGRPALGRSLLREDESPNAPPVAMLSYRVWQDRYGKDPSIVGKTIRVDEVPRVIVGVGPRGVNFPESPDLWIPLIPALANPRDLIIFGRLAHGIKLPAARAELNALAKEAALDANGDSSRPLATVEPFLVVYGVYAARAMFYAMLFAVGFVLLIVCADVANLLLARAAARSREISVRIAIGAGRVRIIRQLLIESVLLAGVGGFFGWLVALAGLRIFDSATSKFPRPSWVDFSMQPRVFLYLAALSLGAGVLFGLAPALRLAKVDVNYSIKDGGQAAAGGRRGTLLANLLVAVEMALCVVLLAGAGLLIRSSVKLYNAPLGVNPANVLTMRVNLPEAKYSKPQDEIDFQRAITARLAHVPGVETVSLASSLPASGFVNVPYELDMAPGSSSYAWRAGAIIVGEDYFRVMQIEPRLGRVFEGSAAEPEVVVNLTFAQQAWPDQNPLGKRLRVPMPGATEDWLTVIGVIPDVQQNLQRPLDHDALVYVRYSTAPQRGLFITARTRVPAGTLGDAFRKQLQAIDPNLPAFEVRTLEDRIAQNRLNVGAFSVLFSIFAGIALVLASVGIYAVMAQSVSQRTQEIGLRLALGGAPGDIRKLLFRQAMRPLLWGLIAGLPLAFGVTRVLRGTLVGVSPNDPLTFAGVVVILIAAGMLGCVIPVLRATRLDPLVALRCD